MSHSPFSIQNLPFTILDGALATELERRGADLRDQLWSARLLVDNPALIRQVHLDYFNAGADVATTASYQATFAGFARLGLDHAAAAELMRLSVHLALEAREQFWANPQQRAGRRWPLVAASIGPYGAFLADGSEYRGHYGLSVDELIDFHRPRMAVLAESGADLFACETIPCPQETQALLRLLAEFPHMSAWLSYSCRDGQHVCQGEPFAECAALANESPQVMAVGVNCTAPRFVEELLQIGRTVTDKPLVCYPNSGEAWDAVNRCWVEGSTAADFADLALRWRAAGAQLIGGCCRTTPEDIRALRAAIMEASAMDGSDHA